jgi:hypothetical protein
VGCAPAAGAIDPASFMCGAGVDDLALALGEELLLGAKPVATIGGEPLPLAQLGFGLEEEEMAAIPRTIRAALKVTGAHLADHVLTERRQEILAARERLVERLGRMAG